MAQQTAAPAQTLALVQTIQSSSATIAAGELWTNPLAIASSTSVPTPATPAIPMFQFASTVSTTPAPQLDTVVGDKMTTNVPSV
jgi:hypothetical protein